MTKINKLHFNGVDYDIGDKDIHDLTEKTILNVNDEIAIADSNASYASKKIKAVYLPHTIPLIPSTSVQGAAFSDDANYYPIRVSGNIVYFYKNGFLPRINGHNFQVAVGTLGITSFQGIAIYNGYIYAEGFTNSGTIYSLHKCSMNDDTTVGANWSKIATLPSAMYLIGAYNNKLFILDYTNKKILKYNTDGTQATGEDINLETWTGGTAYYYNTVCNGYIYLCVGTSGSYELRKVNMSGTTVETYYIGTAANCLVSSGGRLFSTITSSSYSLIQMDI